MNPLKSGQNLKVQHNLKLLFYSLSDSKKQRRFYYDKFLI